MIEFTGYLPEVLRTPHFGLTGTVFKKLSSHSVSVIVITFPVPAICEQKDEVKTSFTKFSITFWHLNRWLQQELVYQDLMGTQIHDKSFILNLSHCDNQQPFSASTF